MQEKTRREFLSLAGKGMLCAAALSALPFSATTATAEDTAIEAPPILGLCAARQGCRAEARL